MEIRTYDDLFRYELSVALDLEKKLLDVLPKFTEDVDDDELKNAITGHVRQTQVHVDRLRRCFSLLHAQPFEVQGAVVPAFDQERTAFHDAAKGGWVVLTPHTVAALETVEHMEAGLYRALSGLAQGLNQRVILAVLEDTLWDEEQMARNLERIGRRLAGITEATATTW